MKVNDPNLSSLASTGASGTQQTSRSGKTGRPADSSAANSTANSTPSDDIHLSELVRSLRSLAADSPERQAHIEQIARAYAEGTYKVDPEATAAKIIDDASQHP
jgi:flagellar biosynthesis anti-sigma factor FlgM